MDSKTQKRVTSQILALQVLSKHIVAASACKSIDLYFISCLKALRQKGGSLIISANSILNFVLVKAVFFVMLFCSAAVASGQATTTVNGPSDATSNPPASASTVDQVLPAGNSVSLKIGTSSTSADAIYQWYKLDNTGTKRLVQSSSSATLSETPSGAGYYIYQLVVSNSNQCSSEISDPFKVYVLPPLAPTVAASNRVVCSNGTNTSVLTANPGSDKYTYQYQWMLNGSLISGATSSTYTTPTNLSNGDQNYSIKVTYSLNTATSGTASQVITVTPLPAKPAISIGQ